MIVLSCNVRASTMANDRGPASWRERGAFCLDTIEAQAHDIFALQECSAGQFSDFLGRFGRTYRVFWTNPYVDTDAPENAVFYLGRDGVYRLRLPQNSMLPAAANISENIKDKFIFLAADNNTVNN